MVLCYDMLTHYVFAEYCFALLCDVPCCAACLVAPLIWLVYVVLLLICFDLLYFVLLLN